MGTDLLASDHQYGGTFQKNIGVGVGMKIGVENGEGHMWDSVATLQTGLGIDMDGCPLGCLDYPAGSTSPVVSAAVCYPGGRGDAGKWGFLSILREVPWSVPKAHLPGLGQKHNDKHFSLAPLKNPPNSIKSNC